MQVNARSPWVPVCQTTPIISSKVSPGTQLACGLLTRGLIHCTQQHSSKDPKQRSNSCQLPSGVLHNQASGKAGLEQAPEARLKALGYGRAGSAVHITATSQNKGRPQAQLSMNMATPQARVDSKQVSTTTAMTQSIFRAHCRPGHPPPASHPQRSPACSP